MLGSIFGKLKGKKVKKGIGLDIGSRFVKLVLLERHGTSYGLLNYALVELPPEAVVGKEIMDRQAIIEKIVAIVEEYELFGEAVTINVAGKGVILRRITVPRMTEKELTESIERLFTENVPFEMADVIWDYKVLPPATGNEAEEMDLLLVAVRNDTIYSMVEIIKEVGLEVAGIDVDPLAINHALDVNGYLAMTEGNVAVINIGFENTTVMLIRNGYYYAHRDIPVATKVYTEALMRYLDLTFERAIDVLIGREIEGTEYETVSEIIETINNQLLEHIDRLFPTFRSVEETERPATLYLTGGGAWILGLRDFLQEHYQITVDVVDPFMQIAYNEEIFGEEDAQKVSPLLTIATGLALKHLGAAKIDVNLLPYEERPPEERIAAPKALKLEPILGALAFIGLAAYIGLTYTSSMKQISQLDEEIMTTRQEIAQLKSKVTELKEFERKKKEIDSKLQVLNQVSSGRYFHVKLLNELNRILPSTVWITSYSEEGGGQSTANITLSCKAIYPTDVTDFMRSLEDSPFFSNVQLQYVRQEIEDDQQIVVFEIKCTATDVEVQQ